jgi:phytanoyl-CoA hydroxylase
MIRCQKTVVCSGASKTLRQHRPAMGDNREDGHALTTDVSETEEDRLAPAKRGSITIHDEWVVHGSGGNTCKDRERRTYVLAYRAKEIVQAERRIGFTHSHNGTFFPVMLRCTWHDPQSDKPRKLW